METPLRDPLSLRRQRAFSCPSRGRAERSGCPSRPPALLGGVEATPAKVRRGGWAAVAAALLARGGPGCAAAGADERPVQGARMIENEVGIDVTDCGGGSLRGRIMGLRTPRDEAGRPKRVAIDPDPALLVRPLFGVTVLDGLLPVPDGPGYGLAAALGSADVLVARVYPGMPVLGVNPTLLLPDRAG
jgi:hypothetical protein